MYYYKLYGNIVESELEFPVLIPTASVDNADIKIAFSPLPPNIAASIEKGNKMGQGEQICWLDTPYGTFVITHGKYIHITATQDAQPWELRPFVIGFGMAVIFQQRNILAFHCSTVSLNGKACIFAGYSGCGKSTTTATFLEHGALLMADDMVVTPLRDCGFMAEPAYPQQKLCADAAVRANHNLSSLRIVDEEREKYAINCKDMFCDTPMPIAAFFLLSVENVNEVTVSRLTESEALEALIQNLFLSISIKITGIPHDYLLQCILFSKQVPVYRISRPQNSTDTTSEIYKKVMDCIS